MLPILFLLLACGPKDPVDSDSGTPLEGTEVSLEQIATEDQSGLPVLDGETVTTTGLATVASGVLGGRKLRIHVQAEGYGCAVDADEEVAAEIGAALGGIAEGDELRLTGLVTQQDLPSESEEGDHDGLTRLRLQSAAGLELLSSGNPLPEPETLTLDQILSDGDQWEGILVQVVGVHKAAVEEGEWVTVLDSSNTLDVLGPAEEGPLKMRLGKGENTGGYGEDPGGASFTLVGPLREDRTVAPESDPEGTGFEIWPRSDADIIR